MRDIRLKLVGNVWLTLLIIGHGIVPFYCSVLAV